MSLIVFGDTKLQGLLRQLASPLGRTPGANDSAAMLKLAQPRVQVCRAVPVRVLGPVLPTAKAASAAPRHSSRVGPSRTSLRECPVQTRSLSMHSTKSIAVHVPA